MAPRPRKNPGSGHREQQRMSEGAMSAKPDDVTAPERTADRVQVECHGDDHDAHHRPALPIPESEDRLEQKHRRTMTD